jgi:hypothetical protein
MRVATTLLVAAAVGTGSAPAAAGRNPVLADALHAMRTHGVSVRIEHGGRRLVFKGAVSPLAQWKAYVAAGVYAARGFPLRSVRIGGVTSDYPAANCACYRPGIHRVGRFPAAPRRRVLALLESASRRVGARIDRIELLHPLAYAPMVTVTVRDPRRFVRRDLEARLGIPLLAKVEGFWVTVRGPRGRVFLNGGVTVRSYDVFGNSGWAIPA